MLAPGQQGSEDERNAERLIEQMGTILSGLRDDIPGGFAKLLFERASPEDILPYEARELAALAEDGWAMLLDHKPNTRKIRVESRPGPLGAKAIKTVTIVEILNDDMPFLLDSVLGELAEQGVEVRLVVHPVFAIDRDQDGVLYAFRGEAGSDAGTARESFIHLHVERIDGEARRAELTAALERVVGEVAMCVQDWRPMMDRVSELVADLKASPPPLPVDEIAEAVQFLEWLCGNHFTFLGFRHYTATATADGELEPDYESGLGILRDRNLRVLRRGGEPVNMTPEIREFFREPRALIIIKTNVRSRIHRRVYMDYVGVKHFDVGGNFVGEYRIVGLLTSSAYNRSTRTIPYLRRKVDAVLRRADLDPDGHNGKSVINVLENYPRDELFQIDDETLYHFTIAIAQLEERPRVRVLARRDRFDRFVSILVYVPRERYDSAARTAIGRYLAETYKGRISAFYPFFPEGHLVRVHFIIGRSEGETPNPDRATLEQAVSSIVRTWTDGLQEALLLVHDPAKAQDLFKRYRESFSPAYREAYPPATAVGDIRVIDTLSPRRELGVDFYRASGDSGSGIGFKVWSFEKPLPLSARVPVLENMGFRVVDERTFHLAPASGGTGGYYLHDMILDRADGGSSEMQAIEERLEACFLAIMSGRAENDGYNALVLAAGLSWGDVALVRAISRYLRQVQVPYSQDYMWETLRKHATISAAIVALFHARFDPRANIPQDMREDAIMGRLDAALEAVEILDEDRILRRFVNAIMSALRTNFYQPDAGGLPRATIAIKYDSRKVEALPLPRPLYEIYVYSPRVEGVHMRFGKVARGGLRWSDRPQDFRTEVLGLCKAQQVKNAVIVPVGAKGGFVPRQLPSPTSREAYQTEGIAAYTLFVSNLLDITDNITPKGIVTPAKVIRQDDDDPYLVVAADKGTATFSDIANRISSTYEFWLGDAFASGGSAGYDHKKMGITARGAWEAVKRHFREMDIDIGKTPFTVAGVGDMSGDVFGNGMLLERTIKLVAAFDHRDIFIDPTPDPETSLTERRRLFDLTRSSWQEYNKDLISPGGGVYSRTSKEIHLSEQARALLGVKQAKPTAQEVMNAILKMRVDLLWFGGIGTYVRSAKEANETVGDRANDAIRVTGTELGCKVIGEGANLGMTQRGRVETAQRGIRLNTDAIDNSAGVNTSDVEVNIKIALSEPVRDGRLELAARNALLVEMTDEVGELVLRNNYLQTLALSLAERRGLEDLGYQQRLMQSLEGRHLLDRAVEYLPDDIEIADRQRRDVALTRPELAVLLAYAKLTLYASLLETRVPDDPYLGREMVRYFPRAVSAKFADAVQRHRLRREIIATQLANSMINRGGPTLIARIADQTGASVADIALAFTAVRDSFGMTALNTAIDALDTKIAGRRQLDLYAGVQNLLLDQLVWFLRNVDFAKGLSAIIDHYRTGIEAMEAAIEPALPADAAQEWTASVDELTKVGLAPAIARRLASLPMLAAAADVVQIADQTGKPISKVAATYFSVGTYFKLDRIVQGSQSIAVNDHFDRLALDRALDSIETAERRLTAAMVAGDGAGAEAVDAWVDKNKDNVDRIRGAIDEMFRSGLTLSKVTVAASLLGDLVKD